jgi:peptidoglycan hydrolase-like protein with peptidoglycan-binding domain
MHASKQKADMRIKTGWLAAFAARVQKNPALAGGTTALGVAMIIITANAVWYQPGKHPSPMFSTRLASPGVITGSVEKSAGKGRISPVKTTTTAKRKALPEANDLTREVQSALADKGLYSGVMDGIYGAKTRSAIIQYQQSNNLKQTGKVSAKLLTQIVMSGKAIERVPVPKFQVALTNSQPLPAMQPAEKGLVSAIQSGLKNYGYDDIVIDGVMGDQTSQAIRRFELDYGLQITGEASTRLLQKLKSIGAIEHG